MIKHIQSLSSLCHRFRFRSRELSINASIEHAQPSSFAVAHTRALRSPALSKLKTIRSAQAKREKRAATDEFHVNKIFNTLEFRLENAERMQELLCFTK